MNRLLLHLNACDCHRKRQRFAEADAACERLNALVGGTVEAHCRTIGDREDARLYFILNVEPEQTEDYDGAEAHLAGELYRIADELIDAADLLKGGAA